jgi:hypothetical protein
MLNGVVWRTRRKRRSEEGELMASVIIRMIEKPEDKNSNKSENTETNAIPHQKSGYPIEGRRDDLRGKEWWVAKENIGSLRKDGRNLRIHRCVGFKDAGFSPLIMNQIAFLLLLLLS